MYVNISLFTGWLNYPMDIHQRLAECIGIRKHEPPKTLYKRVLFMNGRLLGNVKLTKSMTHATLKNEVHMLLRTQNQTTKYHEPSHHIGLWDQPMKKLFDKDMKTIISSPDPLVVIPGIFDISKFTRVRTCRRNEIGTLTSCLNSICWHPTDKSCIAAAYSDMTIKLWDIKTNRIVRVLSGHSFAVCCVQFNSTGTLLVSASADKRLIVWDLATGKCRIFSGHRDWVNAASWNPTKKILASGSDDNTVKLWDVDTCKCLQTFSGHIYGVSSVAWDRTGKLLASGSVDTTIKIWDMSESMSKGMCIRTLTGHTHAVYQVSWNKFLSSSSSDGTLKLWNIAKNKCIKTLTGHRFGVSTISEHPTGAFMASAAFDQTVKLWDISKNKCYTLSRQGLHRVRSVTWSPMGLYLACGSYDQTITIWGMPSDDL